jgi:hypothetical protein
VKLIKGVVLVSCCLSMTMVLSPLAGSYAYKQKNSNFVVAESCTSLGYNKYARNLREKFVKDWYPPIGNGPVEPMKLRMYIRRDGEVYGQQIVHQNGFAPMDEASLATIKRLKKTGQLPKGAPAYVVAEWLFFQQHKFSWDVELRLYSPDGAMLCKVNQ